MKRPPLTPILFALAAPAMAASAAAPPAGAPHPSASAHATSVAGQSEATRIEACSEAASTFIDRLDKGDYSGATSNFDDTMHSALDADKLGQAWQSVGQQFGKLQQRGAPQNVIYQGMAVVTTPLHFEKGDLAVQVACDANGKFAGFHVLPVSSSAASAQPPASN